MADETFSAKQIARRIGTDAKTFRKWLRSTASPYKAVGQGQRYEFPQQDLSKINKSFNAWKDRGTKGKVAPAKKTNRVSHPKVNEEPPMKRLPDSSLVPREATTPESKRQRKLDYEAELAARGAARDEEYGTIDGEEPTEHQLWLLEQDTENWDPDDPRWIDAGPSSAGNPDTFTDGH